MAALMGKHEYFFFPFLIGETLTVQKRTRAFYQFMEPIGVKERLLNIWLDCFFFMLYKCSYSVKSGAKI